MKSCASGRAGCAASIRRFRRSAGTLDFDWARTSVVDPMDGVGSAGSAGKEDNTEPLLTVDGVLVSGRRVLLIERTKPPYMDKLVFPGGHVEEGEELKEAVVRELVEEVGVEVSAQDLTYLIELSEPGRDPRPGHRVAHVYWMRVEEAVLDSAVAGSDARALHLVDIDSIEPDHMGFDHYRAIERLREVLS